MFLHISCSDHSYFLVLGHVARMGEKRNVLKMFTGNPEGKRLVGRSRHRWESNIKMYLEK